MKISQLTRGDKLRLMYVESKGGLLDGVRARVGWVAFSKTGRSVYYRDRSLTRIKGGGVSGNFVDVESGEEFWVSGVKQSGSNTHPSEQRFDVVVDDDALAAYELLRARSR